jgi:selenocysteine lyase/cysteine desulfurase
MEMMARWGHDAVLARLAMLTSRMAEALGDSGGVILPDPKLRAPHILSLGFPDGIKEGLVEGLAAQNIHVARRLGRMRISPHVYNDEEDADRFVSALRGLLRRA